MEYNKIQETLESYIHFHERSGEDSIKWNEYRNLEEVYKNNSLANDLIIELSLLFYNAPAKIECS